LSIASSRCRFVRAGPDAREQVRHLFELLPADRLHGVAQACLHVPRRAFHGRNAVLRDARIDDPTVLQAPRLLDHPAGLESIEEAREVRVVIHHPLGDLPALQPVRPRTLEDTQDVELRRRQVRGAEDLGDPARRHLGRAQDLEEDLLLEAGERPGVLIEASRHEGRIFVARNIVKRKSVKTVKGPTQSPLAE